jgi:hypothetical protein
MKELSAKGQNGAKIDTTMGGGGGNTMTKNFFLYISGLFNNAVSSSDYAALIKEENER